MKKGQVSYGILTPLIENRPPCMVNSTPWYFDPLISNQEIGRGSKYHGEGVKIPWVGGRYTIDRGSKYHG
jgi:hypothetical protein